MDKLNQTDVARLVSDGSTDNRADMAAKVAAQFGSGQMSEPERLLAEDIMRAMVRDAEVRVREALSSNLKESADTPPDVALALARDVESVALPILEYSKVLGDDDLVEIVRLQGAGHQGAIARRDTVSTRLVDALVDSGEETVVADLVANSGADIAEGSMQRILDDHGDSDRVKGSMVQRTELPMGIAERLVNIVADSMRDQLMANHELPPDMATDLLMQARERATLELLSDDDGVSEQKALARVEALARQLDKNGRLTPSIILRALCMGDLSFFEASLARRAGVPTANAKQLVHDTGRGGLKSLFASADMPPALFPAVRVALDLAHENNYGGGANGREAYCRCILDQILTGYEGIEADDLTYLPNRLSRLVEARN